MRSSFRPRSDELDEPGDPTEGEDVVADAGAGEVLEPEPVVAEGFAAGEEPKLATVDPLAGGPNPGTRLAEDFAVSVSLLDLPPSG